MDAIRGTLDLVAHPEAPLSEEEQPTHRVAERPERELRSAALVNRRVEPLETHDPDGAESAAS